MPFPTTARSTVDIAENAATSQSRALGFSRIDDVKARVGWTSHVLSFGAS